MCSSTAGHLRDHGQRGQLRAAGLADQVDPTRVAAVLVAVVEHPADAGVAIAQHVQQVALQRQQHRMAVWLLHIVRLRPLHSQLVPLLAAMQTPAQPTSASTCCRCRPALQ